MGGTDRRGLGMALCAGAAAAYSTAGYFTRLIPLDVWTILFWRGLFAGGFVAACFLWQQGRGAADGILAIGESVKIHWMRPAIRCVITTHPQAELQRDMMILRTAAQHHGAYVGVFASVAATGRIRVGDPVVLVPAPEPGSVES